MIVQSRQLKTKKQEFCTVAFEGGLRLATKLDVISYIQRVRTNLGVETGRSVSVELTLGAWQTQSAQIF